MATKRGDKSRLELTDITRKENKFTEIVVSPNDTLQGIALLYNTTVADLKRINHFHTDSELHAHRIIKVPARGVLVNLQGPDSVPILVPPNDDEEEEEENGQAYLDKVALEVKNIKEKADIVAAKSVIDTTEIPMNFRKVSDQNQGELKWWKILLPCLTTLIVFPILYFFYRHHLTLNHEH